MVEGEAVRADCIAEVPGVVCVAEQIDEFTVVRGRQRDMLLVVSWPIQEQFPQHGLAGRDPFDGVRPPEQLVQQEESAIRGIARVDQCQQRLDFRHVVALAADEIVGPADAAADDEHRRRVGARPGRY